MIGTSTHFHTAVREALKHYTDAAWLGNHSPLATPYMLAEYLRRVENGATAVGRGQALQQLLLEAAEASWQGELPNSRQALLDAVEQERTVMGNGGVRFLYLVLDLRFLRHYFSPRTQPISMTAMYSFLHISESAFYRYLAQAVKQVTDSLMTLIRPNLHLEQPTLTVPLIGRDTLLAACLDDLNQGRSVALSGMGGIGKTTLATAVSESWASEAVFWYTFRPGLNDDLNSLLFAFGHFLHGWDCNNLWLQMIVQEGALQDVQQALGFLQEDISRPGASPFLFCFDEVDLLHTGRNQPRHGVHKQLLELLEALCAIAPVLLVGQRALIDTASHYPLQPLKTADVALIFEQNGRSLSPPALETIYRLTQGNPRLVELYLALLQDGVELDALAFRRAPAVKPLFHRLWKRLSQDEKFILASLSVFQRYAPQDEWENAPGFTDLQHRQLLKQDAQGGVALLPLFRELVYEELEVDQRRSFHHQAAIIRTTRGQYTAAAAHFVAANEIETAVQLWFSEQKKEITTGNAGAAYDIFVPLSGKDLSEKTGKQLKVIQNRLHLLNAEAEAVLAGMDNYSWHLDDELSVDMAKLTAQGLQQWGEAHIQLGQDRSALTRFDEAITILGELSAQIVDVYASGRGRVWMTQANFQAADKDMLRAQFEIEQLQLRLKLARREYRQAQEIGENMLALAQKIGDDQHIAQVYYYLANSAGQLGDLTTAQTHAEKLFDICERTGNRILLENMRAEMAGFYLNVGRYAETIEPAERARRFFERVKNELRLPHIYSNLAEAYYETGQLDKAEEFAHKARNSENPRVQPYACYTLGLIHQANENYQAAGDVFHFGLQVAAQNEDRFIAAYLHRVYGLLLLQQSQQTEGMTQLQTALNLFTEMDIPHEIEKTKAELDQ
jgi:tetratricopeptide (TPR) repeat protein